MFAVAIATMFSAQSKSDSATAEGKYSIGVRATDFGFRNEAGLTNLNAGIQAAIFAKNKLALVGGVNYVSTHNRTSNVNDWFYNAGMKYYFGGFLPVQVDWNGSIGSTSNLEFVGTQLGYAWFPSKSVSIETKVRYDFTTQNRNNVFSGGVDVNFFF